MLGNGGLEPPFCSVRARAEAGSTVMIPERVSDDEFV